MARFELGDRRATITLDDPERHNPLSTAVMSELDGLIRRAGEDDGARVIVITGAGERTFSAGGDLSSGFVDDALGRHRARGALASLFRTMRASGKPIVARVNGHALGGGFGLVCASDIAIAADTATFGMPEVDVGLWGMMITPAVVAAVGPRPALELMLTGRRLTSHEARDLGVVSRVVAPVDLDAAVDEVVGSLAEKSPAALRLGKDSFYASLGMPFDAALDHLQIGLTAAALTEDAAEGIAAFLGKRRPEWEGR